MSVLSSAAVGKESTGEDPQEQNPKGQAGQSGEGPGQSTGLASVQAQGRTLRAEGPQRDTPVCLLSQGAGGAQRAAVWSARCRSGPAALWDRRGVEQRDKGAPGLLVRGCGVGVGWGVWWSAGGQRGGEGLWPRSWGHRVRDGAGLNSPPVPASGLHGLRGSRASLPSPSCVTSGKLLNLFVL